MEKDRAFVEGMDAGMDAKISMTEGCLITDEQQVKEMELVDAATAYAQVEKLRAKLSTRKSSVAEWNAIDRVHRTEKKLYALFTEGDRSMRMNGMFNQFVKLLLNPPAPQA
jgi:hypothetical protein